jgi:hypothetical protein
MSDLTYEETKEVRAHPLFKRAVNLQMKRVMNYGMRKKVKPPHPDTLIERIVGWSAAPQMERLIEEEGEEIQRESSADCARCNGVGHVMLDREDGGVVPRICDGCRVWPYRMWAAIGRRYPALQERYSFELQLWGVVAAMVADEAMAKLNGSEYHNSTFGVARHTTTSRR